MNRDHDEPRPYRILMRSPQGFRFYCRVDRAFGPFDVKRQAKDRYPDCALIGEVEEIVAVIV